MLAGERSLADRRIGRRRGGARGRVRAAGALGESGESVSGGGELGVGEPVLAPAGGAPRQSIGIASRKFPTLRCLICTSHMTIQVTLILSGPGAEISRE